MTLEEMKQSSKLFLIPSDIADVLESDPHTIRCTAREKPELVGYSFTFSGSHMKIPRVSFLRWLGESTELQEEKQYGGVTMTAIRLLEEPKRISGQIERCLTEMQWLVGLFCRIVKNMDIQSQDAKQILADMADFCTSNGMIISDQMKYLEEVNKQVTEMVLKLENPTERDVLFKMNVQGMTLNEIAEEMDKSCDCVNTIHILGIRHLLEILSGKS